MAKNKVHVLLAIASNIATQAQTTRTDLIKTFGSKQHHFSEKITTLFSKEEGVAPKTEIERSIQTTVKDELQAISKILARAIDSGNNIDVANTMSYGDIMLDDGTVLASHIPATSLLQLEHRLKDFHDLLLVTPTLDPTKGYELDAKKPAGIYKAREVRKDKTRKDKVYITVAAPTNQHPAQVKEDVKDIVVGEWLEQEWCSMITPAMKSTLLSRCEDLTRAVKRARARANDTEIETGSNSIGLTLLGHILKPLDTPPLTPATPVAD